MYASSAKKTNAQERENNVLKKGYDGMEGRGYRAHATSHAMFKLQIYVYIQTSGIVNSMINKLIVIEFMKEVYFWVVRRAKPL